MILKGFRYQVGIGETDLEIGIIQFVGNTITVDGNAQVDHIKQWRTPTFKRQAFKVPAEEKTEEEERGCKKISMARRNGNQEERIFRKVGIGNNVKYSPVIEGLAGQIWV